MPSWDEFDIGGLGNRPSNDVIRVLVLEPTAVCVMPAKMRVDHVAHSTDIALTGLVPRANDQPGVVKSPFRVVVEAANMLRLHVAVGTSLIGASWAFAREAGDACHDITEPGSGDQSSMVPTFAAPMNKFSPQLRHARPADDRNPDLRS